MKLLKIQTVIADENLPPGRQKTKNDFLLLIEKQTTTFLTKILFYLHRILIGINCLLSVFVEKQ
jgi:hypothetical protein